KTQGTQMMWLPWLGVISGLLVVAAVSLGAFGARRWRSATQALNCRLEAARIDDKVPPPSHVGAVYRRGGMAASRRAQAVLYRQRHVAALRIFAMTGCRQATTRPGAPSPRSRGSRSG
ncbi:MAG: hypothetical protein JZU60_03995, partial [Ilumatobacteraceae bacterium]|nr:hypothetical protein [Ilumatobacteraceae bacterium]